VNGGRAHESAEMQLPFRSHLRLPSRAGLELRDIFI
jgi:hypothetical protein